MKYPPRSDTSFLNQSPLCRNFHPAILMKFSNWKIHKNNFWELVWALSKISSYNHHSLLFLLAFPEASGLANLSTLVSTTIVNARKVWLKTIVWKSKINLGDIARAGADNFSAYFCGQIPGMVRSIFVLDNVSYPTSGPGPPLLWGFTRKTFHPQYKWHYWLSDFLFGVNLSLMFACVLEILTC